MITKMKILTGQGVLEIKNFKRLPMSTIVLCIVVLVFLLTGCGSEQTLPCMRQLSLSFSVRFPMPRA